MLDVSALPTPPSFTYGGHLFVLELQNISPAGCSLQSPQVALVPTSDTNNQPFYAALRTGDPGYETESRPQLLEPGACARIEVLIRLQHLADRSLEVKSSRRFRSASMTVAISDLPMEPHSLGWRRSAK